MHLAESELAGSRPSATIRGMKLQFSTSTLLKATAFVAIACATMLAPFEPHRMLVGVIIDFASANFWVPFIFAAYCIGKRELNWKIVLVFACVALAAALSAWTDFPNTLLNLLLPDP
jgi:hypothetical protein